MVLKKKGKYWYGTTPEDVQSELVAYSKRNGYAAVKFSRSVCGCGNCSFELESDQNEGAARRTCTHCSTIHLMGDSDEFASDAEFERRECTCDAAEFELLSGVALYEDSNDVRWCYIGCQCTHCHLV